MRWWITMIVTMLFAVPPATAAATEAFPSQQSAAADQYDTTGPASDTQGSGDEDGGARPDGDDRGPGADDGGPGGDDGGGNKGDRESGVSPEVSGNALPTAQANLDGLPFTGLDLLLLALIGVLLLCAGMTLKALARRQRGGTAS